ncbi:MAG: hypothetical protein HY547_02975 [Elusimicrobia bacterium]|nr:hypothetical protein [Elusimicrobiota bacterium]
MMRYLGSIPLLRWLVLVAVVGSCVGCSAKGSSYVGRWECSSGGGDFLEIKANNGALLVTDEDATYPASLDDKGTLIVSVPLMGSLPLPIDSQSRELISSAGSCKRFNKVASSSSEKIPSKASSPPATADDEGATRGKLSSIRSALSIYYGDKDGKNPSNLKQLAEGGKYLDSIPKTKTGHHPESDAVYSACDTSQLSDKGGWAYCGDPTNKNWGAVWADCAHKDSKGVPWYER